MKVAVWRIFRYHVRPFFAVEEGINMSALVVEWNFLERIQFGPSNRQDWPVQCLSFTRKKRPKPLKVRDILLDG